MNTSSVLLLSIVVLCTLLITSCDNPKVEDTPKPSQTIPAGTTIGFETATIVKPREDNTYTQTLTKTNAEGDAGTISYKTNYLDIATVDNEGTVTFVHKDGGRVTITATKAATPGKYRASSASYTLITDMSYLFREDDSNTPDIIEGYGLGAFNGDISKWKVGSVTDMKAMFYGNVVFAQNLNSWQINAAIKRNWPEGTAGMFQNSGLKDSLPSWCETSPCKTWQE